MEKWRMIGECVSVDAPKAVGRNGFVKRTFVLCEDKASKYPELMEFELVKERVNLVTEQMVGKRLDVQAYPSCREWKGTDGVTRYFHAMRAVQVDDVTDKPPAPNPVPASTAQVTIAEDVGDDNNLPF